MMMMMMEWAAVKVLVDRQLPTSQSPVAVGSFKICSRQAVNCSVALASSLSVNPSRSAQAVLKAGDQLQSNFGQLL